MIDISFSSIERRVGPQCLRRGARGKCTAPAARALAPVAVFLASDQAKWLTGEIVSASGGLR